MTAPHPSRFDPARPDFATAMAAHQRAVAAGQPGYLDPSTGLFVMTAANLVERGWCCDRGCRHCPYVGAAEPPHASDDSPEEPR
ncbi:MAG: DUF5522 domain-containing protein [Actinomycetota bacterium]